MSALSEENGSIARRARAAAQPYVRRRPRRSQRLGHQPNKTDNMDENDHDDEDDMVLNGSQKEETPAAARGGLFSRLFSFFPLGGSKKTMPEVEEPTLHDAPLASTHSEQEDDKPELETSQESLDTVMEVAVKSPVTEIATLNGHTASPVKTTRSPPSKRSSPSKRMSPAKTKAAEKKPASPAAVSSVFGHGTEKTKSLKIVNGDAEKEPFAFQRLTGRRRNKPSSPRVAESPLAVIKKKKPISFEEYERLSSQLRNLVETTPENALALTRSTLSNAFESRGSSDAGAVSDGRDRRELSVAALPSVKRARPSEDLPITLPREDRLSRKPKPSRLLTGTKRDAAARSAYSAAVAEKILSTLNKIQTPLDKESQKPTPSTSLSWAKYQIALTKQDASNQDGDTIMGADDEDAPPTMSIPKVAVKSVEAEMPARTVAAIAKNPVFSFSQPAAIVQPTPVPEMKKSITPTDETRKVSAEAAKPKPVAQNGSAFAPALSTKQKMGHYAFTVPVAATTTSSKHSDDDSIQYIFTPPPALREPPKRSPGQKSLSSKAAVTTAPFSFMPSSPRVRPESLTKSVPPKVKSPEMSSTPAVESPAPLKSATNPLARFMQSDAGSWRCPTCAVMNGAKQAKCPCCETSKPSSVSCVTESSTPEATTSMSSTSAGTNPLARFMQMEPGSWKCPSCAVTNGPKYSKCPCCDTDMPGNVSASNVKASQPSPSSASAPSSSGFKFGVASSESKKADTTEPMTSGFNFGSNAQNTQATATPGFSFGVPSQTSTTTAPGSGGFTFGVASTSASTSDSEKSKSGFTFGAPTSSSAELTKSHKRKTSDEGAREGSEKKPATSSTLASPSQKTTGGFTFGSAATSTVLSSTEGTTQSSSTFGSTSTTPDSGKKAFSFGSGVVSAPKPTVPSFGATQEKKDTPSFTFGASSAKPVEVVTEAKPSFTLGESSVKPKDMGSEPKSSFMFGAAKSFEGNSTDGAKTSFTFTASSVKPSEEKSADSNPSFTFGGSSVKPSEVKSAESKPSFTFGASTVTEVKATDSTPPKSTFSMPSTNDTALAEKKPSFTFGASATTAPSKPAFSFGSTTSEANPSVSFGTGSSTMSTNVTTPSAPAFTFGGASSDSSSKKADAPAFTFGAASTGGATSTFGADKVPSSGFGQSAPFGSSAPVTSGFGVSSTSFGSTPSTSIGFGSSTSIGFGSSATTAATSSGFGPATSTGFGSATSSGFGSATSSGFGANTSSGFGTTGSTSFGTTTTSTAFGSTPASTPSFGATPASTPGAPAFSFGASTPATSQPAFGFSAPSASSAFTTPTTSGFGSNSHTPGFGSAPTSGGFGSAAPSTGFGMNSTPAFGSTPTPSPGFGAGANGSGFGGNGFGPGASTSTGFGVPTPTPSPAFGGSSATFGTPSSVFGTPGSAFGATPSPAPAGFGAPSPVFGAPATPAFGAPPTPSFGTPAGGFGGTPGFGGPQPATDGFSMGSAPPKGRRILKAKPRAKRT